MALILNPEGVTVPISQRLIQIINNKVNDIEENSVSEGFTVSFKDTHYHPDHGGYHPVEIGILKGNDGRLSLHYITDFSYAGHPYPELVKEIDFEFHDHKLSSYLMGLLLNEGDSKDLFRLWEGNFLDYVEMGCFDEIEVNIVS